MANPNSIILKGNPQYEEYTVTDAVVVPGMLLKLTATGVRPHNSADGAIDIPMFAVEMPWYPSDTYDIDTSHAIGDKVRVAICPPGTEVYAFIEAGHAVTAVGNRLASAGDGSLQAVGTPAEGNVVAQAIEIVDNSGGGTRARLKVKVA